MVAVCWKCPRCNQVSCEDDVNCEGRPLACDHCERTILPGETLCPICDGPNPWARRDTIHFWCRQCGTRQMFLSHAFAG